MTRVLYVSYDGMTDPLGQSQVLPYLVALSSQGYKFTLLSFEKSKRFEKEKHIIEEITRQAAIEWVPLTYTRNPPVLSKIYDRWRLDQTAFRLFRQHKFDMIHCRSYVAAETGLRLKKRYGCKFLFDMRGFWADEKVDSGQWNLYNPFFRRVYRHYKTKEKQFLLHADGIISLTRAARSELLKREEYRNLEIEVIPCCADLDHFNYQALDLGAVENLRKSLGIEQGKKIISYLGSIGGWYMTREMFSFYKQLLDKHPEFLMLLMTKDDPSFIQKEIAQAGIPADKVITCYAGRKELPLYIALSDCSIFFIRPTYSKIASSPTKHAELMGMGIPVICNNIGDTGAVIAETATGLVVKEFSGEGYNEVIDRLDWLLSLSREKIRNAAFRYFDLEKGAADYLRLYQKILKD